MAGGGPGGGGPGGFGKKLLAQGKMQVCLPEHQDELGLAESCLSLVIPLRRIPWSAARPMCVCVCVFHALLYASRYVLHAMRLLTDAIPQGLPVIGGNHPPGMPHGLGPAPPGAFKGGDLAMPPHGPMPPHSAMPPAGPRPPLPFFEGGPHGGGPGNVIAPNNGSGPGNFSGPVRRCPSALFYLMECTGVAA